MITFEREGNKVVCYVRMFVPTLGVRVFRFNFCCDSDVYASLLREKLSGAMEAQVGIIRQKEYAEGYKDARAKRGKKQIYSTKLNILGDE